MHANHRRRRHSPRDALAPGHAAASRRTGMPPWLVVAVAAATAAMAALFSAGPAAAAGQPARTVSVDRAISAGRLGLPAGAGARELATAAIRRRAERLGLRSARDVEFEYALPELTRPRPHRAPPGLSPDERRAAGRVVGARGPRDAGRGAVDQRLDRPYARPARARRRRRRSPPAGPRRSPARASRNPSRRCTRSVSRGPAALAAGGHACRARPT